MKINRTCPVFCPILILAYTLDKMNSIVSRNMGAWGPGNFDNDQALSWVDKLIDSNSLSSLKSALEIDAGRNGLRNTGRCCQALAAAEVLATLNGFPSSDFPDDLLNYVERFRGHVSIELTTLAIQVVERIDQQSVLQQLFDEQGRNQEWHMVLADTLVRLRYGDDELRQRSRPL